MLRHALTIFSFTASVAVTDALPADGYHPVIVAGPLVGQSLEVKEQDGGWCDTDDFFWAWGNPAATLRDYPCLPGYLELAGWDNSTGRAVPKPGVEVRPMGGWHGGWASLASFERPFSPSPMSLEGQSDPDDECHLGPRLRAAGFVQDESFFGHPYDWRLSVGDWAVTSFPHLKTLIEQACAVGGADKAVLTGISMAGPYIHAFLSWMRVQDPQWAQQHVHAFVPLGGPFNGAVNDLTEEVASLLESYFATETECPDCTPSSEDKLLPKLPSTFDRFKNSWLVGGLLDYIDDFLTPTTRNWPAFYFIATGVDSSTTPPTDPTVVTLVNGELPAACSVDDGLRSKCGAQETRNGWTFNDPEFLSPTQCAACYVKPNSEETCSLGYEMALDGWTGDLCCERHECPTKEYHASELPELFRLIGREESAQMMEHALTHGSTSSDPGVPVHCIFGYNVQTFSALAFSTTEDMDAAIVTLGNGDGTVDLNSLEVCTRWASTEKVYKLPGLGHTGMLGTKQVLDVIMAVALNDAEALEAWKEPTRSEIVAAEGCLTSESSLFNVSMPSKRMRVPRGRHAPAPMKKADLVV